ncbi:ATP-binding cassette domain-containing protein [Candidatus Clostridium stratigraminis]|uniref:ATP-binding cassette domain-containing protein n=1 Tax=Candidatus Clostridium stratigraminis TaxID=3381661 RepID=A0ABW8SZX6_9CLOT
MQTDTAISVSGLEKSYGNLKVLDKINFTVKKGSIFALLGSNGSGKTTTIKILSTLLSADKGSIQVCGFDAAMKPRKVRGAISLTGQFAAVDDVLTGRENLRMIGKLRHLPNVNKMVDELLERFQLSDAADRRVNTYSGGMRRRLDLAMSLMGNPPILFLDEPTTGLDPQSRLSMWKIIKDLASRGITVFLTTQYLDEADELADQIAILDKGKIVAEGTAGELKKLVPHGYVELRFNEKNDAELALKLLNSYKPSLNEEECSVSITTDGSIKEITSILISIEAAGLNAVSFSQKEPTLENVFLTIIGENRERRGPIV